MPIYTYKCSCGETKSVIHRVAERPAIACPSCQGLMALFVTGGSGSFVRGMTSGKYFKEDRQRRKKNAELGVRQMERYGGSNKLVPNIDGQEVESWKAAASLAKDKGLGDTSKFQKYLDEESNSQNSAKVNEKKLKVLKDIAKNIH